MIARWRIMVQMWMSVLRITEAAIHTPTAPTYLETLPVHVCPDTLATDSVAQVILHLVFLQSELIVFVDADLLHTYNNSTHQR